MWLFRAFGGALSFTAFVLAVAFFLTVFMLYAEIRGYLPR
jgi:hypothetical protein